MPLISQREARRLQKRVAELSQALQGQHRAWAREWVGGVHLGTVTVTEAQHAAMLTARKLGHAVVVTTPNPGAVELYALPLAK